MMTVVCGGHLLGGKWFITVLLAMYGEHEGFIPLLSLYSVAPSPYEAALPYYEVYTFTHPPTWAD